MLSKRGTVARIYLPPDANCLLFVADHGFRSRNYVNLVVIDKQPQLQWLDIETARVHGARGASAWAWASNDDAGEPDVVLAAAGDVPTLETVAAAWWLRRHAPELKVRVVNVVDLMTLFTPDEHPHGMVVLNGMSRYHLCIEALRRRTRMGDRAAALTADCQAAIERAVAHSREHMEDLPEIRDSVWAAESAGA
jgi:phosphoketolase